MDKCKHHISLIQTLHTHLSLISLTTLTALCKNIKMVQHYNTFHNHKTIHFNVTNNVRKSISMSNTIYPEYLRSSKDDIYTDIFFKTLLNSEDCCSSSSSYSMNHNFMLCLHWGFKGCVTAIFAMAYPTQRL